MSDAAAEGAWPPAPVRRVQLRRTEGSGYSLSVPVPADTVARQLVGSEIVYELRWLNVQLLGASGNAAYLGFGVANYKVMAGAAPLTLLGFAPLVAQLVVAGDGSSGNSIQAIGA